MDSSVFVHLLQSIIASVFKIPDSDWSVFVTQVQKMQLWAEYSVCAEAMTLPEK
jgi:hypothetical protein